MQRPETLALLLRDQPQLQQALDQAGVPSDGRHLVLQLDTPDQRGGTDSGHRQRTEGQPLPRHQATAPDEPFGSGPGPLWLRAGLDITA